MDMTISEKEKTSGSKPKKIDYHMHFEYGDYDLAWAEKFFTAARRRGIDEIGISEHSHTFPEFQTLYDADVLTDDSPIGVFQKQWLKKNKFKHTLDDYFRFMTELRKKHHVLIGIEVCNFRDQDAVRRILKDYPFDYIIGSVHFLNGWGFDASALAWHWDEVDLAEYYERYTQEAISLCKTGLYDVLGHPFNLGLFGHEPSFAVDEYCRKVAAAMVTNDMAVDVNTGSLYRYPVQKIMPIPEFMEAARGENLSIITSSDAHEPEDCGRAIDEATAYAKSFGLTRLTTFCGRQRVLHEL